MHRSTAAALSALTIAAVTCVFVSGYVGGSDGSAAGSKTVTALNALEGISAML
jgi:hypothetical protein